VTALKKIPANPRALDIEYAIRDVVIPAAKLEARGERILKLNIGDPNKYDFDTPDFIKEAVGEAMRNGFNGYSPSSGIPDLVEAIVRDERSRGNNIQGEDVVVTHGVTEALQMIFYSAVSPGDEVLIPGPSYPPYVTYVRMVGGIPIPYRTIEEEDWKPDVDDIESKITEKTKAIAIINPNNPTGALYDASTIRRIGEIASNHGLFLISDEIYNLMTFEGETPSTASECPDVPVITMNGISKIYLAPGWRIGYLSIRDVDDSLLDIRDGIMRQSRARLCANSICEYGYLKALEGDRTHILRTMEKLGRRREIAFRRLNEIEGISSRRPGGAFYMFPRIDEIGKGPWRSDKEFSLDLLETEKVLTVFGSGFGKEYGSDHFRIVILPQEEVLHEAFDRLGNFMESRLV
jgi:aspartate/methionine/tyrosine aminotransferase